MTSEAKNVDEYLQEVPEERLAALKRIRSIIREIYTDFSETMSYGMPSYEKDGVVHVGFASQRQNIALYVLKEGVVNAYRHHFPKSAVGKGCLRYRNPEKIDFDLMTSLLTDAYNSDEEPC